MIPRQFSCLTSQPCASFTGTWMFSLLAYRECWWALVNKGNTKDLRWLQGNQRNVHQAFIFLLNDAVLTKTFKWMFHPVSCVKQDPGRRSDQAVTSLCAMTLNRVNNKNTYTDLYAHHNTETIYLF